MKNLFLVLSALCFALGCATSKTITLSDGTEGHAIDCSGSAGSWSMCYE
jgi:hypothetical protein